MAAAVVIVTPRLVIKTLNVPMETPIVFGGLYDNPLFQLQSGFVKFGTAGHTQRQ